MNNILAQIDIETSLFYIYTFRIYSKMKSIFVQ